MIARQTRKPLFDFHRRSSGILMHITSLPGPHGSGDLGSAAHDFVEFLADAGQTWWQTLPIGPPGRGPAFSPYDSPSAFAGSPWLVSLQGLARCGLLARRDLRPARGLSAHHVNFSATLKFREARLREGFANFQRRRGELSRSFRQFCEANSDWLDDYALFMALRRVSGGKPWTEWDDDIRVRKPSTLRAARERLAREVAGQRFVQFEFNRQWRELREHAHRRGIRLIGDLPIFVAHDSADVWSHSELFQLDRRGRARRVSGYPPDRFNRRGQHWGHPQYDWPAHERTDFSWWVRRFARMFELYDAVRIDHFLGFTRTWSIPAQAANARAGRWVKSPGAKLLKAVEGKLGRKPMIAEDLGHVTAADVRLRDAFGLAPMRILQFGFGAEPDSAEHLPHNYTRLCVAYTGNHDNNTIVGWFKELPAAQEQRALSHLGEDREAIHTNAIRVVMASPANVVLFPMQDVLGLNQRARMNMPGTMAGNWSWRLPSMNLAHVTRKLGRLTKAFGRNGGP
ncbi:MAG: 4-alpha-glucanotransferase [Verrucomicrobia subdivision 3 bacterium]|nr:4-alpha-glucanotransferase [Limisphaerales bacterium]